MDFFGADPQKYPPNFNFIHMKTPEPENFNITEDRRVRWLTTFNAHKFQLNYKEGDEAFSKVLELHQDKVRYLVLI